MNMAKPPNTDEISSSEVNAGHLLAFIERIERLEEEKKALTSDIKEVYGEAKANGFDVKIMRKIVSIRKQDRDSRIEEETVLDLYLAALGMRLDATACLAIDDDHATMTFHPHGAWAFIGGRTAMVAQWVKGVVFVAGFSCFATANCLADQRRAVDNRAPLETNDGAHPGDSQRQFIASVPLEKISITDPDVVDSRPAQRQDRSPYPATSRKDEY